MLLVAGAGVASSGIGAAVQYSAAKKASNAQSKSAAQSIAEQRRQFDAIQKLMAPYVKTGNKAIAGQQNLIGLNGATAQRAAIQGIQAGPEFGALVQQGENSILQNASATGGLRGGNTQAALAQFRPAVLSNLLNQRFAQLGGLATAGQNAAAGVGVAGQNAANAISQGYADQGAARAGGAIAQGNAITGLLGNLNQNLGNLVSGAGPRPDGAGIFSSWGF